MLMNSANVLLDAKVVFTASIQFICLTEGQNMSKNKVSDDLEGPMILILYRMVRYFSMEIFNARGK